MVEVMKYIHENINRQLSVSEVADHFGYARGYFCAKFHLFAGVTFGEYVRHYRMQLAAIEILQNKKIIDVALDMGYDTPSGFNKAFLKEYGCLPRQYKKQARESQLYYERRKVSMYPLSNRCQLLREEVADHRNYMKKYFCQRTVYFCIGTQEAMGRKLSYDEVVAYATANVIKKFTPCIIPGEIITGFNYGTGKLDDRYCPADTPTDRAYMRENHISDEDIEKFFAVNSQYKTLDFRFGLGFVPESAVTLTQKEQYARNERSSVGRCMCANHSVIGYDKVLKLGFSGILKEIEESEKRNGGSSVYSAMKLLCSSAMLIGHKYAQEARRLLQSKDPEYQSQDLERIIQICDQVPRYPARNFMEAVQALWFAHIINSWEDCINANSLGRLDQILYPYYQADLEKGILTKEEAFEIICCLWLKLYQDFDVQQSCIGGTTIEGKSAVNELSYFMLDATERLDFIRCLSVRYSSCTEKEFLRRALEVVGHMQKGIPFFFNDDVMIPALVSKGISKEDAYDYTQLGCVETVIPGKSNPHAVSGETNLLKAVEFVLNNGRSLLHPEYSQGIATGDLNAFDTYEKFYEAILLQIDGILELSCSQIQKFKEACIAPKPFKSILTQGCIETGTDFNQQGAQYDYYQVMLGGVPNLADSLMVIKKFIYEDKKYSLEELKEILYQDYPIEAVRLEFVNKAPKFGNDVDEVDSIAIEIVNYCCDRLEVLSRKYGMEFHAQPFTYLWLIHYGLNSAASADGRRKGEPVAYSVSPMQGRDFNGLTAALNSIAKLPTKRTPGTTSAIVEVDPKLFTDANIDALTDILVASSKKGLSNVQFNVVDAETLMDAQKYPEKYNSLAVRVSGFSQKFNLLTEDLQNHIIGRTKHRCL